MTTLSTSTPLSAYIDFDRKDVVYRIKITTTDRQFVIHTNRRHPYTEAGMRDLFLFIWSRRIVATSVTIVRVHIDDIIFYDDEDLRNRLVRDAALAAVTADATLLSIVATKRRRAGCNQM